jgi:hypothetical protein
MAMAYGNVYVAQVAFGAKDVQTVRAFLEAESYDGPVAADLLLALHRPRRGPVQQPAPAGHGGGLRPLAAVPLRPAQHRWVRTR